jgi:hypothetical protein
MEKNILLEIQRIKKLMSIEEISDFEINENLKTNLIHNENSFLLNEQTIIDDIMKLGGVALKNEDLLKNILKEIDNITPKAEKIKLDDILTDAEKKLSRVEQLEIFAKKLVSQADNIERDYAAASNNIAEWMKFKQFLKSSTKKVSTLSARVQALTTEKTTKVFEDTNSVWNKIYKKALIEIESWIKTFEAEGTTLTEKEILEEFNKILEKYIKEAAESTDSTFKIPPHPQNLTPSLKTYSHFYDWAYSGFAKSQGKMDELIDKYVGKSHPRETAETRFDYKNKLPKVKSEVDDLTLKTMGLKRNYSFFEKAIRSLIDRIRAWFIGYSKIAERLEQREIVIKNYDWEKALNADGIPSDLEQLFRAHLNDMEMLGNYEKNVLQYFDDFKQSLILNGIKSSEIDKAFQKTEIYKGGFAEVLLGRSKSLQDILDDYEIVFRKSLDNPENSKIHNGLLEYGRMIKKVFGEIYSDVKTFKKNIPEGKMAENSLQTLKKACITFSANIFSFLSYFSLFSYRSLGRILRLAGPGGVGSIMAAVSSFVIADITLVIWKKILKQFFALGTWIWETYTEKDTGGVNETTYNEKLAQESLAIWAHWFNPTYQTWLQSDVPVLSINTYGWVAPIDPINSPLSRLLETSIKNGGKNSSQTAEKLNQTYNEQLLEVWELLKKDGQKDVIKTLEIEGQSAFARFKKYGEDPDVDDRKLFYTQNDITKEEFEKIIKSEIGKLEVDSSEVKLDVLDLIKKLTSEKLEGGEFTKTQTEKIKQKIKVGAYLVNSAEGPKFYTTERDSNSNSDRKFYFLEIPFKPYYDYVEDKSGTDTEYAIFFRPNSSSKAQILNKDALKNLGVDVNSFKFGQKGYLLDEDQADEIKDDLNNSVPEPTSKERLNAKQFANLL